MNKSCSFTLLLLLLATTVFCQNFEGRIVYNCTYISKIPQVSNEQFTYMMGSEMDYMIKEGSYKIKMNGSYAQGQTYDNAGNRLYDKMANNDTLFWRDGSVNNDEIISAEETQNAEVILGYNCNKLVLTCKSGTYTYFYAPNLPLNVEAYSKHVYGNFYETIKRGNGIPLKFIVDTPQFKSTNIAIKLKKQRLDAAEFQLPPNAITAPSRY